MARLPYSVKVLLENVLRLEDGRSVTAADVEAIAELGRDGRAQRRDPLPAGPGADAGLHRGAGGGRPGGDARRDGGDRRRPGGDQPAGRRRPGDRPLGAGRRVRQRAAPSPSTRSGSSSETASATPSSSGGSAAFDNFRVVPPATGICHQVNLEYIAQVVYSREVGGVLRAYPDTLVGTDSHTTMVNGLGVLGWGVGGIEAEAAMLGQPISMLLPQVVGFKLGGALPEGATATDLVLTVTEMLRARGVVSKFVEFFGPGLATLGLADRATIGNMSPEFGSTCAIFPVDAETLRYLELTGRPTETIELVDAYAREQGMFHEEGAEDPVFSDLLELDLGEVVPSIAGPKRPQDRVPLAAGEAGLPRGDGRVRPRRRRSRWATGSTRRSGSPSRPRTRRPRGTTTRQRPAAPGGDRRPGGDGRRARQRRRDRGDPGGRDDGRAGPRPGGDRRDHQLHQHLEPERDDRRRPAGPQRGGARAGAQAVGEDVAGAGLDGGHRLPGEGGADRVPRRAAVQPGRVRVHHLHRQLGAAARRRSRRRSPRRTWRSARCSPATATSRGGSTRT